MIFVRKHDKTAFLSLSKIKSQKQLDLWYQMPYNFNQLTRGGAVW